MGDRKVLNKYYPPDFDPSKLAPVKRSGGKANTIRLETPFSMHCLRCGEFIYKGKKFNARKELCKDTYLGIKLFRFHIKCTGCSGEIAWKSDPKNTDYVMEIGAKRNFEVWKTKADADDKAKADRQAEEEGDAFKAAENKMEDQRREMQIADELADQRARNARMERVDLETLLRPETVTEVLNDEDIEDEVKTHFGQINGTTVKRRVEAPDVSQLVSSDVKVPTFGSKPKVARPKLAQLLKAK